MKLLIGMLVVLFTGMVFLLADERIPINTYCYTADSEQYFSNITMDNCNQKGGKLLQSADYSVGECKVFETSIWYGKKVWNKTSAEKDCKSKGGQFNTSK